MKTVFEIVVASAIILAIAFGPILMAYALEICLVITREGFRSVAGIVDTIRQNSLDRKNHVRRSTMTHDDFERWLTNTCANTPNRISKYISCESYKAGFDEGLFYKIITKVQTKQGTYDDEWRIYLSRPFGRDEDTLYAENKRDKQLLKESFFASFKKELDCHIEKANRKKDHAEPKPDEGKWSFQLWRPVQYWEEVAEDLEYIDSQLTVLTRCLFGE